MSIIATGIAYTFPDRHTLFSDISFSVAPGQKTSLIGSNGAGKSTLLDIIAGRIKPSVGEVSVSGTLYEVPQHYGQYEGQTISQALNIDKKIKALQSILNGDLSENNYALLDDDWQIEERTARALEKWGLDNFGPHENMSELSGGEKTKVFLAGIDIHQPSVILMDEPSNHLDSSGRKLLYDLITGTTYTMLIVSHDRQLLNLVDCTIELDKTGITRYGGNYDFYEEQYELKLNALHDKIADRKKTLAAERRKARQAMERKQKEDARGEKKQLKAGLPRIMMNTLRDGAEKSATQLKDKHIGKIEASREEILSLKSEFPDLQGFKISLDDSSLHKGKILVEVQAVMFGYSQDRPLWQRPLDLKILSGDHLAFYGDNGSGKSTLLQLITGQLEPTEGEIRRAGFSYVYFDQEYSLIKDELTVLAQVEQYNKRNLPDHMLKTELARFLFPYSTWDKKCHTLSGGEKMRLALCCLLIRNDIPDMMILDEPTNSLDIRSMAILTEALKEYRGTVVAISHDQAFLADIGITTGLDLHSGKTISL